MRFPIKLNPSNLTLANCADSSAQKVTRAEEVSSARQILICWICPYIWKTCSNCSSEQKGGRLKTHNVTSVKGMLGRFRQIRAEK